MIIMLSRELQITAGRRPYTSIHQVRHYHMVSYTIHVHHIPMSVSAQLLQKAFSRYGSCRLNLRHPRIDAEQHALVNYTSLKEAHAAARAMTGAILDGGRITATVEGFSKAVKKYVTVRVDNISKSTSEDTLEEVLGFSGEVEVAGVKIKHPAVGPTYAYLYYHNTEDAQRAVSDFNDTEIDGSVIKVEIHPLKEKLQVECEPQIVRIITSPDRPEYRSQLQSIERTNLVKIKPVKDDQGFDLQGNKETLEEVRSHLEFIISKIQERQEEKSFTLPFASVSRLGRPQNAMSKKMSTIERKHSIQLLVFDSNAQQMVAGMSGISKHIRRLNQLKSRDHKAAVAEVLEIQVRGLRENVEQAVVDIKDLLN